MVGTLHIGSIKFLSKIYVYIYMDICHKILFKKICVCMDIHHKIPFSKYIYMDIYHKVAHAPMCDCCLSAR